MLMKIHYVTGLVKKAYYDTKIIENKNKIPNTIGFIKKLIMIEKLEKVLLVQLLKLVMTQILDKLKAKY